MLFICSLVGVALGGLVRRDEVSKTATTAEEDLCGTHIATVCEKLGAGKDGLQGLMTSSSSDTDGFLAAVGLSGGFACKDLCVATLKYAQTAEGGSVQLPPANAVVCEDAACQAQVSVDEDAVASMAVRELEAPILQLEGMNGEVESTAERQEHSTEDEPEPGDLTFTPQELTRSLLVLFDVYAVPSETPAPGFLEEDETALVEVSDEGVNDPEFGPKIRRDRYRDYTKFAAKGAALVRTAILRVESRPDVVEQWFGDRSVVHEVKNMFQKQLKTILDLHIKKGDCSGSTLAYVMVWTNTRTKAFVRSDRDRQGQYIVHMCEYFWDVIRDFDYRYGTIIHEAAHHHGPTDVKLRNGQTAYGRRNNIRLVREQGALHNADNFMTAVLVLAKDQIHAPLPRESPPPRTTRRHSDTTPAVPTSWTAHQNCVTECGATEYMGHSLADMQLGANTCVACDWVQRERWGGEGCKNGYSLGKKSAFQKMCCWKHDCSK
jgi:hypothetical protein